MSRKKFEKMGLCMSHGYIKKIREEWRKNGEQKYKTRKEDENSDAKRSSVKKLAAS